MASQGASEENFDDLFVDRNLLAVFRTAPTVFSNKFNGTVSVLTFVAITAFSVFRFWHRAEMPGPGVVSTFSSWGTMGWAISSTLLGFLVAGFALLCTVLRPSAVVALHRYYSEGDDQNALRNLFVFFVDIFISYLLLLVFSLAMVVITSSNGPYIEVREVMLRVVGANGPSISGYVLYCFWSTWFVVLVLKLKSFVYNLYQALMIGMTESVHSATECANMVTDHQIQVSKVNERSQ
jgi:hypothetical protein